MNTSKTRSGLRFQEHTGTHCTGENITVILNIRNYLILAAMLIFFQGSIVSKISGQPEVTAWGNMTGIRVDGQLMEFETSLCLVGAGWSGITQTAKERQLPRYARDGNKQIISTKLGELAFTEVVEDSGPGIAMINVQFTSGADTNITGVFFCIDLPGEDYSDGTIQITGQPGVSLGTIRPNDQNEYLSASSKGIRFISTHRQFEVICNEPTKIIVKADRFHGDTGIRVYLTIFAGAVKADQTDQRTFIIKATGEIDRDPVELTLDTSKPGRAYDGIGGNFRLQNPETDPQVIQYCLDNLRVSWSRVEMPWRFWHPDEDVDPLETARSGNLHPRVQQAMEMAQKLYQMGIPVILSDWSAPDWAIQGILSYGPQPGGLRGNPLDPEKIEKIYESITGYIICLKENFGVEVEMFSFNESDLGIYVRQTGIEHAELIKGLGAYLASRGLKTKLLLGDTADANGYEFIKPAMADPETHYYIGAVSFHSWRGWATETLTRWADAAQQLNVPLIVGEGSIDAAAWRYPAIFEEPTYALEEINLYTRILAICQPLSILQWQLTADYSVLSGGGIFGNDEEPLHPTQRFWNLKQLGSAPRGVLAMPITSNSTNITCAALGDNTRGTYVVHLVNNGSTRQAELTGLPDNVKDLQIYITDSKRGMEEGERIQVTNGKATFTLESVSFTTLISD